jgi:hypothetical protein
MIDLSFLKTHARWLAAGLLLTFVELRADLVIALFGGRLRAAFELSHGDFGSLYTIAAPPLWSGSAQLPTACPCAVWPLSLCAGSPRHRSPWPA